MNLLKHLKTYKGIIKVNVGLPKNVPNNLENLYTLCNRLRALTNRLDQGRIFFNWLRILIID